MTAAEITPTQLIEIDGRIVSEAPSGLVRVELESVGDKSLPSLTAGDSVAFRPVGPGASNDRFLGTVVSSGRLGEVTLLLDRVSMTLALTADEQQTTPFSPTPNTNEFGNRYF